MAWSDNLLPASWRGLRFAVEGNAVAAGRRLAVHEYPYRDTVWPEDLGKAPRRHSVQGFLIGDDAPAQRRAWLEAAEQQGPGTLVHPTLGSLQLTLLTFSSAERKDLGRVVELQLEFITASDTLFPTLAPATGAASLRAATAAIAGIGRSYATVTTPAIAYGSAVVDTIQAILVPFGQLAMAQSGDAGQAATIAAGLQGNYGRYGAGSRESLAPATATVATLLAAQTAAQAAVTEAAAALSPAADAQDATEAVPAAVDALVGAVRAAANNPLDQLRVGAVLAAYSPAIPVARTGLGNARNIAATAVAALARRRAAITMAQASADYSPASYDEAVALRDQVTAALDAEITAAGDAGEDDAYLSLRELRSAVAEDLTQRAARLARLRNFAFAAPLPALALAQMIYRTGARADDLARRANPPHPAFMPTAFQALAV